MRSRVSGSRALVKTIGIASGIAVLSALLATWFWWPRISPPATPDPRRATANIWRNINPEVQYVGDESCASCHAGIARSYRAHPMGQALSPIGAASASERFDHAANNPFDDGPFRYQIDTSGPRMRHRETLRDGNGQQLAERSVEISFAVGSGRRGRSYLIDLDGNLVMSPLTWYPQKGLWDLSPGYRQQNLHFTRPIIPECLFCHSNRVDPMPASIHRYREPIFRGHAIGCERCHGPGELHTALRRSGQEVAETDTTIVNPRRLEHELREAVCQQCHLQGEERILRRGREHFDFRPGLPLTQFYVDFVKPEQHQADNRFVGSVEQMVASRCYQASQGESKLGCISCHDPHSVPQPEKKIGFYRARCLACHADRNCNLPQTVRWQQNEDSCVACHMPPTGSEVNHTTITDHRIPRRPSKSGPPRAILWPRVEDPLELFHDAVIARDDQDVRGRDLGIALMKLADRQPDASARHLAKLALPLLERAVAGDADDLAAADAQADALWMHGQLESALDAYQAILTKAPQREVTLHRAAALALRLKRPQLAADFATQSLRLNPGRWQSHQDAASAAALRKDWTAALAASAEALKLHPAALPARTLSVTCYLQLGDRPRAQAEFDIMLLLVPAPQHDELRRWFAAQAR